jgi:hypothetical protein
MWNVLPKIGLLKVLFFAFSAMFLAVLILFFGNNHQDGFTWTNYRHGLGLATPIAMVFFIFVYVSGKWLWKLFWKIPFLGDVLNKSICPNLNGIWSGYIESNFTDENGKRTKKVVELEIKADFFGFTISLRSKDGYQSSKVIQSAIQKDHRTNTFLVSYIFEANVPVPEESDDRLFDGAAKIEVKFEKEDIRLEGTYWTNRAWQRKLNTAGIIKLSRYSSIS